MNCPQCDAETSELVSHSDERIHACAECGQWLDGTVLNALQTCAVCGREM